MVLSTAPVSSPLALSKPNESVEMINQTLSRSVQRVEHKLEAIVLSDAYPDDNRWKSPPNEIIHPAIVRPARHIRPRDFWHLKKIRIAFVEESLNVMDLLYAIGNGLAPRLEQLEIDRIILQESMMLTCKLDYLWMLSIESIVVLDSEKEQLPEPGPDDAEERSTYNFIRLETPVLKKVYLGK